MHRILLLITDLEIGGTPTVVQELAIRLNAAGGASVEVACLSRWGPVADQLKSAGVYVTALDAEGAWAFPLVVRRLATLIRARHYDTVFSFLIHANTVAAAASRICTGVRWLQSIQTTQPTPRWHWKVQSFAQRAAERIVVPSPSVARVAGDWAGVPGEKIVVIPNAISSGTGFQPVTAIERETAKNEPEKLGDGREARATVVGFIGRLDPIKRIPDLLEAMTLLDPATQLHIYGKGSERGHLEAMVRRLGLNDRVTLHGSISQPEDALAAIDVLVLPSEAEGFGLVLIEAMAAGVPVVATNVPGICDVVRDGQTGLLVPVASPEVLAAKIALLLGDENLRQRLVDNALEEVRQRFSWEVVLPAYRKLLGVC